VPASGDQDWADAAPDAVARPTGTGRSDRRLRGYYLLDRPLLCFKYRRIRRPGA